VLAKTPLGLIGMTICYDVRFPNLYRALALQGAEIFTVPSAFTVPTGRAHWHTLLRARAIENACYVIAPAQCGEHPGGRATYGHSLIIDPWGEVIAERVENTPGIITAEMDLARVAEIRAQLPVLQHHRDFTA
jgi:predicted amidohydrolase